MQVKTRTGGHFVTLFEVWQSAPGNEADLLAILDHIPTPIVCSALGDAVRTLYINRQFERTFGYLVEHAPSFSLRGGTREVLRGIIARGLGLR